MNKEEFLKRLEQLLSDISEEERVAGEGGGSDQERSWGE